MSEVLPKRLFQPDSIGLAYEAKQKLLFSGQRAHLASETSFPYVCGSLTGVVLWQQDSVSLVHFCFAIFFRKLFTWSSWPTEAFEGKWIFSQSCALSEKKVCLLCKEDTELKRRARKPHNFSFFEAPLPRHEVRIFQIPCVSPVTSKEHNGFLDDAICTTMAGF